MQFYVNTMRQNGGNQQVFLALISIYATTNNPIPHKEKEKWLTIENFTWKYFS